jgi:hypothetical protein
MNDSASVLWVVGHLVIHQGWLTTSTKFPLLQKHSEQPHTEPKKNQETNKIVNETYAWKQHDNPCNLE